ncbi:hypothetical protein EPN44_01375 [bacterium]|nr:MAG: hypothetical protein EPN44_01375 [bacterium]
MEIYRAADGTYLAVERGRSVVAGEIERVRQTVCADGHAVYEAFRVHGRLTNLATEVLDVAAGQDPRFAGALGDRHHVEDLERIAAASPQVAGEETHEIVLDRDGDRALRFRGLCIGSASSRQSAELVWSEISVYVTIDGQYVVQKAQRTFEEYRKSLVRVVRTSDEVMQALVRPETAWVERAVLQALRQAIHEDWGFRQLMGEWLGRTGGARSAVSEVPQIGARSKAVLEAMDGRGECLIEELDEHGCGVSVRWASGQPELPRVPWPVFRALSRQRLLRCLSRGADVQRWTISKRGQRVLSGLTEGRVSSL